MKTYKLYIFDMDGTLVEPFTTDLLPGVAEWFAANEGANKGIATNQGGVGLRYWMEQDQFGDPEKYPTWDDVLVQVSGVLVQLPGFIDIVVAYSFAFQSYTGEWSPTPLDKLKTPFAHQCWRQDWRKPYPGMLKYLMDTFQAKPGETLMVGDRPEDRQAAQNAGCDFIEADDFFGRKNEDER
jgi:histidinol phosphatase-like enzyme